MSLVKAMAALKPNSQLTSFELNRRTPGPHDVVIELGSLKSWNDFKGKVTPDYEKSAQITSTGALDSVRNGPKP